MNVEERERTALVAQEILPAEPLSLRIADAMKLTGIPCSTLYELIGRVPSASSRSPIDLHSPRELEASLREKLNRPAVL